MKHIRIYLLILFSILINAFAYTQNKTTIVKGIVVDTSGNTLDQATVTLLGLPNRNILNQIRSGRKAFEFKNIPSGNYLILLSYIGYKSDTINLRVTNEARIQDLGKLVLGINGQRLQEVVIKPPLIAIKGDTISYNVESFKTNVNSSLQELLSKLPGVTIENGKIMHQGKEVERVYINGQDYNLNDSNSIKILIQNLRADQFSKIEIFDEDNDISSKLTQINASNKKKAINLKLKKGESLALTGSGYTGYGLPEKTILGLNASSFGSGRAIIGSFSNNSQHAFEGNSANETTGDINYTDRWSKMLQTNINYHGNRQSNEQQQLLNRQTFLGDSSLYENRQSKTVNSSVNHEFNPGQTAGRVKLAIDSTTSILFAPYLQLSQGKQQTIDTVSILNQNNIGAYLSSNGRSENSSYSNAFTTRNSLIFLHAKQRVQFGVQFSQFCKQDHQNGNIHSILNVYSPNGTLLQNNTINQEFQQNNRSTAYSVGFGYEERSKSGKRTFGFRYQLATSTSISNRKSFDYDINTGKYDMQDSISSNSFTNHILSNTGVLYFIKTKGDLQYAINFTMGYINLQNRNYTKNDTIRQDFFNWLPNTTLTYSIAKNKKISFSYSGKNVQPTIDQLRPVSNLQNPFIIRIGNPNLKPQINHGFDLKYNTVKVKNGNSLDFDFSFNYYSRPIISSTEILAGGIQQISYVNATGFYDLSSYLRGGIALESVKKGRISFGVDFHFGQDLTLVNSIKNYRQSFTYRPSFSIDYSIIAKLRMNLGGDFNYTISNYLAQQDLSSSVKIQNYNMNFSYELPYNTMISADCNLNITSAQAGLPGNKFSRLNAAFVKNVFSRSRGEVKLSIFDLLNENKGFSQSMRENIVETLRTNVIGRQFLLTFTFYFKKSNRK